MTEIKQTKMKKGQIWIETVLYTLIGLALIGIVLGILMPRINQARDRAAVEQAIEAMSALDSKILEVGDRGAGNVRVIEAFTIKQGSLEIDAGQDALTFVVPDLKKPYSEPGAVIGLGRIKLLTTEERQSSKAELSLNYSGMFNISYNGQEGKYTFAAASQPYSLTLKNLGRINSTLGIDITSR